MGYDGFLKLERINGESTDSMHAQWIELRHFDHSVVQSVIKDVSAVGGRSAAGGVIINEFVIEKIVDCATPLLYLFCCKGEHIATAIVEMCEATGEKHCYMRWTFTNVMVTTVSTGGSAMDDSYARALETVTLFGDTVRWEYTPVDHAGKAAGALVQQWSLAEGQGQ